MAIDDVSICNSALIKLGVEKIYNLGEASRNSILCNEQYNKKRLQLLQSHYWNFAVKRHAFVSAGVTPEYEFTYSYSLPSDYLRMVDTEYPDMFYQREGIYILSNYSPFKGRYVADISDTTKFSPCFDEALALLIALDLCHVLTQDKGLWDRLAAALKETLKDTRSFDAQENPSYPLMDDIFLNARF